MTSPLIIPAVVPHERRPAEAAARRATPGFDRRGVRGLPVLTLPALPRDASMRYSIVTIDNPGTVGRSVDHGRVGMEPR
jgi:hypothetical protein